MSQKEGLEQLLDNWHKSGCWKTNDNKENVVNYNTIDNKLKNEFIKK